MTRSDWAARISSCRWPVEGSFASSGLGTGAGLARPSGYVVSVGCSSGAVMACDQITGHRETPVLNYVLPIKWEIFPHVKLQGTPRRPQVLHQDVRGRATSSQTVPEKATDRRISETTRHEKADRPGKTAHFMCHLVADHISLAKISEPLNYSSAIYEPLQAEVLLTRCGRNRLRRLYWAIKGQLVNVSGKSGAA